MDMHLTVTGAIPFVLIAAALLSVPVSWLLLRNYRQAVLRFMNRMNKNTEAEESSKVRQTPISPLQIQWLTSDNLQQIGLDRSAWQLAVVHGFAGLLLALVMSFAAMLSADMTILPLRTLFLLLIYSWPLIIVFYLIAGADRQIQQRLFFLYFALYLSLIVALSLFEPAFRVWDGIVSWLTFNLPATLLLLMFFRRSVRAVGALVFIFLFFCLLGFFALISLNSDAALKMIVQLAMATDLDVENVFWVLNGLALLVFAVFAGWLLVGIKHHYVAKKSNELSLNIDAVWLFFGCIYSLLLAPAGWYWAFTFIVAFAVYKFGLWIGLRGLKQHLKPKNRRLLLLRVFSLGKQSEQLFDMISERWRFHGSIQMIAGPDLVTTTIEPHELLDYLSGRLSGLFIDGQQAMERQLEHLDLQPDFDGRYRVNEFFCYDNTWKMALRHLVDSTDVVLMDLRRFSESNAGCITEIHALIDQIPLSRIVLLVDKDTDKNFLQQQLSLAWQQMDVRSPNQSRGADLRIVSLPKTNRAGVNALLSQLW